MNTNVNKKNQSTKAVKETKETALVGVVTESSVVDFSEKPIKFESIEQARSFAQGVANLSKQHSSIKSNVEFLKKVSDESLQASKLGSDKSEFGILVMDLKTIESLKESGRLSDKHTLIKKQEVVHQFSVFVGGVMAKYLDEVEHELLNIQK